MPEAMRSIKTVLIVALGARALHGSCVGILVTGSAVCFQAEEPVGSVGQHIHVRIGMASAAVQLQVAAFHVEAEPGVIEL